MLYYLGVSSSLVGDNRGCIKLSIDTCMMLGLQDRLRCGSDRSGNITTAYGASKASITTSRPGSAGFPPRFHGGHNPVSLSPVEMDRTSVTLVLRSCAYLPTRQLFPKACLNASTRTQVRLRSRHIHMVEPTCRGSSN